MEEKILIQRAQQGDMEAFDLLFAKSRPVLLAHCTSMLQDAALAEDMVQETALKALKALPHFRGHSALPTWFWRIAHNLCIDELRRKKEVLSDQIELVPIQTAPAPSNSEIDWNVWLEELTPIQKEVVILFYIEKLPQKVIAERLRAPLGTIRSRLYYAKKKIKSKLESMASDPIAAILDQEKDLPE